MASKGSALSRFWASDLGYSFRRSPLAIAAFVMLVLLIASAFFAPWISPQNPHDLKQLFIEKAEIPPIWVQGGEWPFLLGTDPQGRDVLSAILYGTRVSLIIGLSAVAVSMAVGVTIGLMAGFFGGWIDNLLMRIADTVLSIPTLLVAILVSAIFRGILPPAMRDPFAAIILVHGPVLQPRFFAAACDVAAQSKSCSASQTSVRLCAAARVLTKSCPDGLACRP